MIGDIGRCSLIFRGLVQVKFRPSQMPPYDIFCLRHSFYFAFVCQMDRRRTSNGTYLYVVYAQNISLNEWRMGCGAGMLAVVCCCCVVARALAGAGAFVV